MANVKTAISIDESLFEQVNKLADDLNLSRSRLFVLAVEEFIHRYENQQLLEEINEAYDDLPTAEEKQLHRGMRRYHRKLVETDW